MVEFPRLGRDGMKGYKNVKVELKRYFENNLPLALNHWIGVWRVTFPTGGYDQYLESVAANSRERAREGLVQKIGKTLWEQEIPLEINDIPDDIRQAIDSIEENEY